jgi:NAD/NADP transhydrogenase alpha subunit
MLGRLLRYFFRKTDSHCNEVVKAEGYCVVSEAYAGIRGELNAPAYSTDGAFFVSYKQTIAAPAIGIKKAAHHAGHLDRILAKINFSSAISHRRRLYLGLTEITI